MTGTTSSVRWAGAPADWPADVVKHLLSHPENGPFGTPQWYQLMAREVDFGAAARKDALVLERGGAVQMVMPMVMQGSTWRPLANYYCPLAVPAGASAAGAADWGAVFSGIAAQRPRPATLQLGPWPAELAHRPEVLQEAKRAGFWVDSHFRFGNWYWAVDSSWPTYWQSRPSALRNTVQRKGRQLARAGGRIEIFTAGADIERGLAAFQAVYADSWKSAEPHPGFIPGLIRLAAQQGWLRLGVAWLADEAVAAQLWLVHGGQAHIYKLAYRERHADLGAGSLLTAALMQHVLEVDSVREVDYGMGDEPYKQAWTPQRRARWALACQNYSTLTGAARAARTLVLRNLATIRAEQEKQ
jgi:hypothetical protein